VSAVSTENEFELEKKRIHLAIRQEKVFFEKIMVVLQAEF
jgi:hypothetical protein